MQATVKVTIRYCVWRARPDGSGRPRFVPSKDLRALGFKGQDLKHADGRWFNLLEAQAWVDDLLSRVEDRRALKASGKRLGKLQPMNSANAYLVANLFADMLALDPKLQAKGAVRGRVLSRHTVRFYRTMANILQGHDPELWASPAAAVSVVVAHGLYEELAFDKKRGKGLTTARGVIASCRRAWSWGRKKGLVRENPFMALGMEMPQGRTRAATVQELRHLVATCDAAGRADVADMILLGVFTGQRQADRLAMQRSQIVNGRFHLQQDKTGRKVSAPLPAFVLARLEAAWGRRKRHTLQHPHVVIDERNNAPWNENTYRHAFAQLRGRAAATLASLADLCDQDMRDTAITWARDEGADFNTRRQLSGHSSQSAEMEEKHYLATAESQGDAAVQAIISKWEKGQ
jgi:integrase